MLIEKITLVSMPTVLMILSRALKKRTKSGSPFPIPKFSHDVELKLRKGNDLYTKENKALDQRH